MRCIATQGGPGGARPVPRHHSMPARYDPALGRAASPCSPPAVATLSLLASSETRGRVTTRQAAHATHESPVASSTPTTAQAAAQTVDSDSESAGSDASSTMSTTPASSRPPTAADARRGEAADGRVGRPPGPDPDATVTALFTP